MEGGLNGKAGALGTDDRWCRMMDVGGNER